MYILCVQIWLYSVCLALFTFLWISFFLSYSKIQKTQENFILWTKGECLVWWWKAYIGIIVRKDTETDMWVTVFEDGEEDQTADPAADSDYTLLD